MEHMERILLENGFKYHLADYPYENSFVIENLEIINYEPTIDSIYVWAAHGIQINLRRDIPIDQNLRSSFVMDGYSSYFCPMAWMPYMRKIFLNENDFIEELQRLNYAGKNIKG